MWDGIILCLLKNWTFVSNIYSKWLILWLKFSPDPPLGNRTTLSCYVSAFNGSTNDRVSSLIKELNPKDQLDR